VVVLDDRLLIEELLVGLGKSRVDLYTTFLWYYRACRAAVLGAGGHLSGPFEELARTEQDAAIRSLLELREDIALPESRLLAPIMVEIAGRHPRLNLLNLEAVASGRSLSAAVWLSPESEAGLLPAVLDAEGVRWRVVTVS
jgi:hypothetical protein